MNLVFKKKYIPVTLAGVGGLRIVIDSEGNPVINPTREVLSTFLDNVSAEGDEIKYTGKAKLKYGYTDLIDAGGKARMKEEDFAQVPADEVGFCIAEEEVGYARVNFLVESSAQFLKDNGKGQKIPTDEKTFSILEFKLFDAKKVNKDGSSVKVFNKYGSFAWVKSDGAFDDKFKHGESDKVAHAYLSQSILGFEELLNFLFSYTTQTPGRDPLLDNIDFKAIIEGDVSSIVSVISYVHANFITDKDLPLYGVLGLFMPVNNQGTNNMTRQEFYPQFEQLVAGENGELATECNRIKADVRRNRKPGKDGRIYDAESKGWYVGAKGVPAMGVREFDERDMDALKATTGAFQAGTTSASNAPTTKPDPSKMDW